MAYRTKKNRRGGSYPTKIDKHKLLIYKLKENLVGR